MIVDRCDTCHGRGYAVEADGDGTTCDCGGSGLAPGDGIRRDEVDLYHDRLMDLVRAIHDCYTEAQLRSQAVQIEYAARALRERVTPACPRCGRPIVGVRDADGTCGCADLDGAVEEALLTRAAR